MPAPTKINKEIFAIEPSTVVLLYVVDLKEKGEYRFHAGENGYKNPIIFNKKEIGFKEFNWFGFFLEKGYYNLEFEFKINKFKHDFFRIF